MSDDNQRDYVADGTGMEQPRHTPKLRGQKSRNQKHGRTSHQKKHKNKANHLKKGQVEASSQPEELLLISDAVPEH